MNQRRVQTLLVATVIFLAHAVQAATTGTIRGTVVDPSGAVVSNAQVAVTNEATNEMRNMPTDSSGTFQFLLLPVGDYTLRIEHSGFKSYILRAIHLDVNQVASFTVNLQVGQVESTVEVLANPVQIDTTSTQVGTVIDTRPIEDLPLNGRNVYQLVSLQPGISVPGQGISNPVGTADPNNPIFAFRQQGAPLVFSSGGGRLVMNNFMVDGGDTNGTLENQAVVRIIPDAVEEFRVLTNTFNPEFGTNSGSVVNIITKSGSNNWHGGVFEFLRNDVLNARNYFETTGKAPYKLNQFGGTFGGPIRKDKTFFFVSYEGSRERRGVPGSPVTVFSDAERGGNFSDREANFAGAVSSSLCFPRDSTPVKCYASGTPYSTIFPNATIPAQNFDPVSTTVMGFIPHANVGDHFLTITPLQPNDSDEFTVKLNHQLNDKNRLSVLYFFDDGFVQKFGLGNMPGFPVTTNERDQYVNISETWVISSRSLNEVRVSYLRDSRGAEEEPVTPAAPSSFGFVGIKTGEPASLQSIPVINISGGPVIGGQGFGSGGGIDIENVYMFADNFSRVMGNHTLKFGGDYRSVQHKQQEVFVFDGDFVFGGFGANSTGDPFADFLLGLPDSYSQGSASYERLHSNGFDFYGQDTWRMRSNLTVNYGLRWELVTPFVDKADAMSVFRFPPAPGQPAPQSHVFPTAPPGLLFPGDPGVPPGLTQTYYRSFAPRIGLSYAPGWLGRDKLVIKTAYGMFYNPIEQSVLLQFNGDPPYGGSSFVSAPGFASPFTNQSGTTLPSPFPFQIPNRGQSIDFERFFPIYQYGNFPPNTRSQYLEQYNLGVEYQLSPTMVAGGAYVGSQGHRLLASYDGNPGNPQLCLQLAAQGLGCGPFGEDVTYTLPSGKTLFGTRPAGVFSNDPAAGLEAFGSIFTINSIANSAYNSGQFRFERRGTNLEFLASYTFSKSLDNASGFENLLNPFCFKCDRELSGFDVRHRFVLSYTYRLPFGRFAPSSGWERGLLNGWEVGGITTFQSGIPVRLVDLVSDNSLTGGYDFEPADRPSIVGPVRIQDPRTSGCAFGSGPGTGTPCSSQPNMFFNPNAFAFEPLGQIGNARHDMFPGPGVNNWDFSVIKRTQIKERYSWEFRTEFFNVFNHAQFLNPDGNIGDGINFGRVTQARDPRFIQFATKLNF